MDIKRLDGCTFLNGIRGYCGIEIFTPAGLLAYVLTKALHGSLGKVW